MTTGLTDKALTTQAPAQVSIRYPSFRWAILATTCLCVIAFQVCVMSYSPILGEIARSLGISLPQSVNLMSAFMLFAAISFFVAGPFCDKHGAAASTMISAALSTIPTLCTHWLGQSLPAVMVIRILQGCAVGFALGALPPLVLRWFPPSQRGLALGIPGACNPLGAIIGVLLSPVLLRSSGDWSRALSILSAFGGVALVYSMIVFKVAKERTPQLTGAKDDSKVSELVREALRQPVTWVGVLVTFAVNWIMQCAFSLSPAYFAEPKPVGLGLGPLAAGQLMGVVQVGAIIGPILSGIALDKLFGGRAKGVLLIAFFLALAYAALQFPSVCNNRPIFLLFLVTAGAGIGMLFPTVQSQIGATYDQRIIGRMNGTWLGLGAFGGSAGLFANSVALKNTGSYALSIDIISAAAIVGFVLCLFFGRKGDEFAKG
jgi:MFS family permease